MIFYIIIGLIIAYLIYAGNQKLYSHKPKNERVYSPDEIATDILTNRSWRDDIGTCAGGVYYRDMWTRDSFFSSLGLISLGEYDKVNTNLKTLMKYQRRDGMIPLRVGSYSHIPRFLFGIDLPGIVPIYHDDKYGKEPTDSNPLFIILCDLIRQQDIDPPKGYFNRCVNAYKYSLDKSSTKDGLLYGNAFDTWHDSFDINGPSLFSNVTWLRCHKSMEQLYNTFGNRDEATACSLRFKKLKDIIYQKYWSGRYFRIYPDMDHSCTAGNALMILFNFTDETTSSRIIQWYENMNTDSIVPAIYPPLKDKYIHYGMKFIGLKDYHNRHLWPWVHCLFMKACRYKNIDTPNLNKRTNRLDSGIFKYQDIYERLEPGSMKPVKHFLQSSEVGFSESAGMYLFMNADGVFGLD